MLVTVSEDATCKIWDSYQSEGSMMQQKSRETLKGHQGKNVRALACMEGLIATGGDDGAVKVWNAEEILVKKAND